MLRIRPSHQNVSTLAYDNSAAAGTSITGTGNAHHYYIKGQCFQGSYRAPFQKILRQQLRDIRPMECLSMRSPSTYPNAHATLRSCKLNVLFQGQPRPENGDGTRAFFSLERATQVPFRNARPLRVSGNNPYLPTYLAFTVLRNEFVFLATFVRCKQHLVH